jgi:HAD superfamily phosphatase (TIGR01668 family)
MNRLYESLASKVLTPISPSWVVATVGEVDAAALKAGGIRAIITDLDNTLVPWRKYEIMPGVKEWLADLKEHGIKICIASNTLHTSRLKRLAATLDIPFVDRVRKPWVGGFLRSMQLMGSRREETAVFGDQIFTDVWCGNKLGLRTILLRPPLSKEEFIWTRLVRIGENIVIRRMMRFGHWPAALKIEEALGAIPDPATPRGKRGALAVVAVPLLLLGAIVVLVSRPWRRR